MNKYTTLLTEQTGAVRKITANRPDVLNAQSRILLEELDDAFIQATQDESVRVIILAGAGKHFSAGHDLGSPQEMADQKKNHVEGFKEEYRRLSERFFENTMRWRDIPKPTIAQIQGYCIMGGMMIASACDLIIAAENATFALPEPRVGLAALAGGVHRLPRQIGLKRAMGMILTARHVSAKEGLELGFVNEVVPQGEALAAAERWAATICKNSPMSIRASKQAIQKGLNVSLEQAISEQREYPAVKAMAASQDYIEGPKAFAEKRPPKWLGR